MNENAARLAWAGAGVRLPRRFMSARPIRRAVERVVGDGAIRARAEAFAEWSAVNDAGTRAAGLVQGLISAGELSDADGLLVPATAAS
jgi:UDP:flavonoid glycosyltransferase YjiC (YdhE family)